MCKYWTKIKVYLIKYFRVWSEPCIIESAQKEFDGITEVY